jgi:hypothetical protein
MSRNILRLVKRYSTHFGVEGRAVLSLTPNRFASLVTPNRFASLATPNRFASLGVIYIQTCGLLPLRLYAKHKLLQVSHKVQYCITATKLFLATTCQLH